MPRTYVDNASNRSLGRVGMSHGTAVVSSSRSSGGGGGGYSSGSSSARTYVDNASNRSLGRVGMEHGTAVNSRSSGGGGYSSGSSSARTYVDNVQNRNLGRVGMTHGTAGVSKLSGYSTGNERSYVDNSANRALGRVGLPLGSAVHSSNSATTSPRSSSSSSTRSYVDNSMNRSLGRVGLSVGSAVHSTTSSDSKPTQKSSSGGCYVDNPYNRRLGRVGQQYGSSVISKVGQTNSALASPKRCYVDNAMNRKLGRVGKVVGSMPISSLARMPRDLQIDEVFRPLVNIDPEDNNLADIMQQIVRLRDEIRNNDDPDPIREMRAEAAIGIVHRHEAAISGCRARLQTPEWVVGGEVIDFSSIALGEKLGSGGFGDVHVGIWNQDLQVAVKKLRVQRVSQKRKEEFQQEVKIFSSLSHPAIIKFYGACVIPPNLAIVMEFMAAGSLYDVLHVEMRSLLEQQKSQMVADVLSALRYMHQKNYAHRDIKSMNILVCDDYYHCKLGDFGLTLKEEARSSASVIDHNVAGTLKYSSPEVVKGLRLPISGLKSADVYSMTIVIIELLTGKEPYANLNQYQVRAAILNKERPSLQALTGMNPEAKELLRKGMSSRPEQRPSSDLMFTSWNALSLCNALGGLSISNAVGLSSTLSELSRNPLESIGSNNNTSAATTSFVSMQGRNSRTSTMTRSSSGKCAVCLDERAAHAFQCGHVTCAACLERLREHSSHCPQCRGTIANPIRLFMG